MLYAILFCLDLQLVHQGTIHPTQAAAIAVQALLFLGCALLDCSPQLSASVQMLISVIETNRTWSHTNLDCLHFLQGGWSIITLYWTYKGIQLASTGDFNCFYKLGTYPICIAQQKISINSNLFFLMTQALISRLIVPGMSIFLNASVSACFRCFCHLCSAVGPNRNPATFQPFHMDLIMFCLTSADLKHATGFAPTTA